MGLRNAKAYSKKYARPYTRKSKKKSKNYIKTIPSNKIIKFNMGDTKGYQKGKYRFILRLVSRENAQARDNSLEACRQTILKDLEQNLPGNYYFSIRKYPHHILRENRMYSGGSKGERVNTGMSGSFGSTVGRAAFIEKGEDVFLVAFADKKFTAVVRKALEKAKPKLPCSSNILFEERKK